MERLTFPYDIFIGLVFNDFIDKDPDILHTYSPYAVRYEVTVDGHRLIMDEDEIEVLYLDHEHPIPQWVAYEIHRPLTIAKLNRFIEQNMTRALQSRYYIFYKHCSGIWMAILKSPAKPPKYWLFRTEDTEN